MDALQSNARVLSRSGIGPARPAMGRRDARWLRRADAGFLSAWRLLPHVAPLFSDPRLVEGLDRVLLAGEFRVGRGDLLLRAPDDVARGRTDRGRGLCLRAVPPDQPVSARGDGGVFEFRLDAACFVVRREIARDRTRRRSILKARCVKFRRIVRQLRRIPVVAPADGLSVSAGLRTLFRRMGDQPDAIWEEAVQGAFDCRLRAGLRLY